MTISFKNKFLLITVSAVLIELLLIIFNIYNGGGNMPFYIFIYFEVFFLFAVGLYIIKSKQPKEETQFTPPVSLPVLIIITGIIFRTTLLPAVPTTSPDVYRYVWEGKVIVNGYNPYKSFPNAPELVPYRSELWGKVGFKNMPAIYPPLAQGSFVIGYLISREAFSVWGIKIVYLICEIFTLVFLLKLLRLKKINPAYIILYAWLPIPLMEYFINAHIDALGISFLVLFLYNIEKGRLNLSAVFLALSFLSKFYPLMLFPLLLRKTGIKKLIPFTLFFLSITILFYLPFITRDFAVKDALSMYISRWEFNGSVYNLIKLFSDGEKARIISTFLLLVTIAVISVRYNDFSKAVFGVLLSFIIFASTVYPWYLGWLAVVNPVMNFYSVISLFLTINFSNFTPMGKVWQEYSWVLIIEYVPFFLLLIFDLRKRYSHVKISLSFSGKGK